MKKLIVLALMLILLVASAFPALAAGGLQERNGKGRGPFALAGPIAGLDPASCTVTVKVLHGNKLVQPFMGQDLTLQTTTATRFLLRNADGTSTPLTFADLAVGQEVSANGKLANAVWTATRITVGAQLIHQP